MISAIVPLYNESENLYPLWTRLEKTLKTLGKYEVIFIDDGSTDNSLEVLQSLYKKHKEVRIFSFRKNSGKAEALTLGFQAAKGERIVTLDADLQDQPEEIPALLKKLNEHYDMVSGWKKNRKDATIMVFASQFFNKIMGLFWKVKLHDYNCGLKAYTAQAAKTLQLYGGMHRFIPLLLAEQGFVVTEIPVVHEKRLHGKSKYGFSKIFRDLPDIMTMFFLTKYGKRPLHFFGTFGGIFIAIGLGILMYLFWIQLHGISIGRRPLLFVGFFSVIAGLQIFFTGFIADLQIHLLYQTNLSDKKEKYLFRFTSDK